MWMVRSRRRFAQQQQLPPPPPPPPPPPTLSLPLLSPKSSAPLPIKALPVSQDTSPLDDAHFDPLSNLNLLFPNAQSLSQLDLLVNSLTRRVSTLDEQIQMNLRHQISFSVPQAISSPSAFQTTTTTDELTAVTKSMQDLVGCIISIKEKSRHAETLVMDLTHDIKSLDYAKRNLTSSMSTLRRLSMLSIAISQLRNHVSRHEYRPIVPLLLAIRQLESHFRSFRNINKVADLINSLYEVQANLQKHILDLFEVSFSSQAQLLSTADSATLNESCLVLDGLEPPGRQPLLQWYTSLVLREYRTLFNGKDELTSLENVPQRYAWLRRYLKLYDEEHSQVFPGSWRADHDVCVQFAQETKFGVLEAAQCVPKTDLKLLVKAMKTTVDFEQYLVSRWATISQSDPPVAYRELSETLEPLLVGLVEADDKRVGDLVSKFMLQGVQADEGNPSVLSSATELFVQYKGILSNITKLSNGRLVADMTREVFVKYLDKYAEILSGMVAANSSSSAWSNPAVVGTFTSTTSKPLGSFLGAFGSSAATPGNAAPTGNTSSTATSTSKTNTIPGSLGAVSPIGLSANAWRDMSLILNTAQYCSTITSQLGDKLKQKTIPLYHSQVTLDKQVDGFKSTAITTIKHMVQVLLDIACEPGWTSMSKVPWGSLSKSGDVSQYVNIINSVVQNCIPAVAETTSDGMMVRTFCDKVAEAFPNKFLQVLTKSKPICEVGAEQALLDLHGLKSLVQKIPLLADPDAQVSAVYTKIMTKGFSRLETLCKVLMTPAHPVDGLVTSFMTVVPERDRTKDVFSLLTELKGLKRQELAQANDLFAQRVTKDNKTTGASVAPTQPIWQADPVPPSPTQTDNPSALSSRPVSAAVSASAAASQMKRMFAFGNNNG